ncbi:sorting nexin-16-like [Branchiostoma lanceolatum]|uniref:sorting nexin-16-like n=1 Tax=Branchiostoma lanceolatum TaxID=7740 RepID=UPI003451270B
MTDTESVSSAPGEGEGRDRTVITFRRTSTPKKPGTWSTFSEPEGSSLNASVVSSGSESGGVQLEAAIVGKEMLEAQQRVTLYKVEVQQGDMRKWIVLRRYKDFLLLNKKLQRMFPALHLNLPPKRFFRDNFDPAFIQQRQRGLNDFIRNLLGQREMAKSLPVRKFFRLDNPPEPHEDLEASQLYCSSLEDTVVSLKQHNRDLQAEVEAMRAELAHVKVEGDHTLQVSSWQQHHQRGVDEQIRGLQQQLSQAQEREQQVAEELQHLRHEIEAERAAAAAAQELETQRRDTKLKQQMLEFEAQYQEVDQKVGHLLVAFSELPNVEVTVGGRSFELKAQDAIPEQAKNLKQSLGDGKQQMLKMHRDAMESYQKEVEDLKADLSRTEHQLRARNTEVEQLKANLSHLRLRYTEDLQGRDAHMHELQRQVTDLQHYCNSAEERYFYSLVIGVKLNMSAQGYRTTQINQLKPQTLYERIRSTGTSVEHWPGWVARELASLSQPLTRQ